LNLDLVNLGVGGVKDTGIDQNTLRLFADGVPITNYGYNVEVSEVVRPLLGRRRRSC